MISVQNARASHRQIGLEPKEQLLPFCQKASTGHPRAGLPRTCPQICQRFRGAQIIPTRNTPLAIPEGFRQVLRTVLKLVLQLVLQPAADWRFAAFYLVPTARLELAQLAPLPPQDSVSTNFTTSAEARYSNLLCVLPSMHSCSEHPNFFDYFGISAAWPAAFAGSCAGAAAGAAGAAFVLTGG